MTQKTHQVRRLYSGTALALITLFAGAGIAVAQTAAEATTKATPQPLPQAAEDSTTVVVVGTRASQQNSINRKKTAKTATDSIVAEDVGGTREYVGADAGRLLPKGDVSGLAAALRELHTDAALLRQMGARARARAVALSWESVTREMKSFYGEVLARNFHE